MQGQYGRNAKNDWKRAFFAQRPGGCLLDDRKEQKQTAEKILALPVFLRIGPQFGR